MVETSPLKWFVREIDISDGRSAVPSAVASAAKSAVPSAVASAAKSAVAGQMFGHRQLRTRSRYDCHFSTGSSVPMGKWP